MLNPQTLKYWYDTYFRADETPDLEDSISRSCEIAQRGNNEDHQEISELLLDFPFTGFFYGFVGIDEDQGYKVSVVHHAFKIKPGNIESTDMIYGIEGLGENTIITEIFPLQTFGHSGERAEGIHTPDLKDFIAAIGDEEKVKTLEAVKTFKATKEEMTSGLSIEGHPLPIAHPRRVGIIPPLLMPAFFETLPSNILPLCLNIIKMFANKYLNEEGTKDLWIACFPTLQLLWILCMIYNFRNSLAYRRFCQSPVLQYL